MNKLEIFYQIQNKLIEDLKKIIDDVKEEYKDSLKNSFVFDYLDIGLAKLKPGKVTQLEKDWPGLEQKMRETVDTGIGNLPFGARMGLKALGAKDTAYGLISLAESPYNLLYDRAVAECEALNAVSSNYNTAEELVMHEFEKVKSFKSNKEHMQWVSDFCNGLGEVFDYIEGQVGFLKMLVPIGKKISSNDILQKINPDTLVDDIKTIKQAVIDTYTKYEKSLMDKRYTNF